MKEENMKYLTLFLVSLFVIFSCQRVDTPINSSETKIVGHIETAKTDTINFTKDNPYDLDFEGVVIASAKIDSNGNFSVVIPINKADRIQIRDGKQILLWNVYIYPEDELNIDIQNGNNESFQVKYKGKSAKANEFAEKLLVHFPKEHKYYEALADPNLTTAMEYADIIRNEEIDFFEKTFEHDTIPQTVHENEKSKIDFDWAYFKIEWALRNYYYNQAAWSADELPKDYFSFLKKLKLNENYMDYFISRYLETLVWDWHIKMVKKGKTPTTQERAIAQFEISKKKFTGISRDYALAHTVNDLITYNFSPRINNTVNKLMIMLKTDLKDKHFLIPIEIKYKKRLSLMSGNPAPDFTVSNQYNAPISLSDFRGKVVYLNFWGTWCNPCKAYFKVLVNLQNKYAKRDDIIFINFALETANLMKWKTYIHSNRLPEVQIYSEGQFENEVAQKYMVNSLPYYYIIDKKGNVVQSDPVLLNPKDLEKTLDRLLKE